MPSDWSLAFGWHLSSPLREREAEVDKAAPHFQRLLGDAEAAPFLGGAISPRGSRGRVYVMVVPVPAAAAHQPREGGAAAWLQQHEARALQQEVVLAAGELTRVWLAPGAALPTGLEIGVGGLHEVVANIEGAAAAADFDDRLRKAEAAQEELRQALLNADGSPELRAFLAGFAKQLGRVGVEDVPPDLRKRSVAFDDERLRLLPFPHSSVVPSVPIERGADGRPVPPFPPPKPWPEGRVVRSDSDVFDPAFLEAYDEWKATYDAYHQARCQGEEGVRPKAFFADESCLLPEWRGCYIDFTGERPRPLDPNALAFVADGNHEALARRWELLSPHGDEEVALMWSAGVHFKTGMPPYVGIHPNLLNFWDDVEAVTEELEAFAAEGWMQGAATMPNGTPRFRWPSFPFTGQAHGQVPKPKGIRVILDMGQPRRDLLTWRTGLPVPSSNALAGPMRPPKWPKEVKPTASEAMRASAILLYGAAISGEPLFELGVDWRKFFHQWTYRKGEAARAGAMVPKMVPGPSGRRIVSSRLYALLIHVMAMGATAASEIAQRGSNSINCELYARMDAAEVELLQDECEALRTWMRERADLPHGPYGTQARLVDARTYTDDPRLAVLGVRRAVRLLCELFDVGVRLMGLVLAEPSKWGGGVALPWVGVNFSSSLGIAWLGRPKAAKLLGLIARALSCHEMASMWREMLGFVEHVISTLHLDRYMVDGLWTLVNEVLARQGPGGIVNPMMNGGEAAAMLVRLAKVVSRCPGVTLLVSVRPEPAARSGAQWDLLGDAALEPLAPDGSQPADGLGGHLYNVWSHAPLTPLMRLRAAISHLEFLQACMLLITHWPRLRHVPTVCLQADALATPRTLARRYSKSPRMRAILRALMQTRAFKALTAVTPAHPTAQLTTRQRWGAANPVGDAASRGQRERLERHFAQLGLKSVCEPYSEEAYAFADHVLGLPAFVQAGEQHPRLYSTALELGVEANGAGPRTSFADVDRPDSPQAEHPSMGLVHIGLHYLPPQPSRTDAATPETAHLTGGALHRMWEALSAHRCVGGPESGIDWAERVMLQIVSISSRRHFSKGADGRWVISITTTLLVSDGVHMTRAHLDTELNREWCQAEDEEGQLLGNQGLLLQPLNVFECWRATLVPVHSVLTKRLRLSIRLRQPWARLVRRGPWRYRQGRATHEETGAGWLLAGAPTWLPPLEEVEWVALPPGGHERLAELAIERDSDWVELPEGGHGELAVLALQARFQAEDALWLGSVDAVARATAEELLQEGIAAAAGDPPPWWGNLAALAPLGPPPPPPPPSPPAPPSGPAGSPPPSPPGTPPRAPAGTRAPRSRSPRSPMPVASPSRLLPRGSPWAAVRAAGAAAGTLLYSRSPSKAVRPDGSPLGEGGLRRASGHALRTLPSGTPAAARRALDLQGVGAALKEGGRGREAPAEVSQAVLDRAEILVDAAARDLSAHALKPASPGRLRRALVRIAKYGALAAPANTLKQESCNWRHWRAVTELYGTAPVRPSVHELAARGTDAREVECALWADAVFIILDRMEAAWRINPRGRPYPPKPSSALQVLRGVRRVHVKRLQVETVPLTLAVAVVEGLLREYAVRHGPEALIPQRKEPLSAAIIERLLHIIATQEGARVAHKVLRCGTLPWRSLAGLIHFMAQCGFRKAEVALAPGDEFGPMHLSMANVVWRIAAASPDGPDGKHTFIVCPTKEQLALLAEGDYAAVRPPPSKADQLGLHWAADPIYLPYHATAAINAARALAELEVMRGVASEARRSSPLFTDGSGKPFTHGSLDALLQGLLMLCGMSAEEARRYSWHSFRSFLACALLAAGKDAATIQCLLRWKTAEALSLYARINPGAYGGHIFDAMRADVESVRSTWSHRVPVYDADARVAAAHAEVPELHDAAARELTALDDEDADY